jgi:hypothetical protein
MSRSLFIAMSLIGMVGAGCGSSEPRLQTFSGRFMLIQVADLPQSDIDNIPANMMPAIQQGGWTRTSRGLERSKIFARTHFEQYRKDEVVVTLNGVPLEWHSDGTYEAKDVPVSPSDQIKTELVMNGEEKHSDFIGTELVPTSDGHHDVNLLWYKLREPEHSNEGHNHGGVVHSAAYVPCLDYNGPFGNCVNYSSGFGRYQNFVASDCDYAWGNYGYCWADMVGGDDSGGRYCNGTKNCSPLIGHSSYHHCHR